MLKRFVRWSLEMSKRKAMIRTNNWSWQWCNNADDHIETILQKQLSFFRWLVSGEGGWFPTWPWGRIHKPARLSVLPKAFRLDCKPSTEKPPNHCHVFCSSWAPIMIGGESNVFPLTLFWLWRQHLHCCQQLEGEQTRILCFLNIFWMTWESLFSTAKMDILENLEIVKLFRRIRFSRWNKSVWHSMSTQSYSCSWSMFDIMHTDHEILAGSLFILNMYFADISHC